jgi:hypothetical protein
MPVVPTTENACATGPFRSRLAAVRQALRSTAVIGGSWAAIVGGGGAAVEAAPPRFIQGPTRFFNSVIQSVTPTRPEPAFIPAPTPPSQEDVDAIERLAAVPGLSRAQRQASATVVRSALPTRGSSRVPPAGPALAAAPRLPTREEIATFMVSLREVAETVATDATNPAYEPQRPVLQLAEEALPPVVVTTARSRETPPLVVSRLQPTGSPPPRTPRFERLRTQIARTLAAYQQRPLNTAQHTPWEVMHGFIAFGIPTQVRVGGPAGDLVNAIGWSNMGGRCRGQVMLTTKDNHIAALIGPGVQGHSAQYLAILAQCRVSAQSPIVLQSGTFTVADLVEEEKLACKEKTELTFSLISLSHYLPTDATWVARDGKTWSLPKLVEEEIVQPIRGAACGGTHRLYGLSYCCQRRLKQNGRLDGVYLRADKYVRDYQQFALTKLQNGDGSFSTEWFKYLADRRNDIDRKIQTTGHILEWLVASLEQDQLYDPQVVQATEFLAAALASEPTRAWRLGPLGHALHALNIYQERAWGVVLPGGIAAFHGPMKAAEQPLVAERPEASNPPATRR